VPFTPRRVMFTAGFFFFSSRRRHTRSMWVTGVQTCALPIYCMRAVPVTPQQVMFTVCGQCPSLHAEGLKVCVLLCLVLYTGDTVPNDAEGNTYLSLCRFLFLFDSLWVDQKLSHSLRPSCTQPQPAQPVQNTICNNTRPCSPDDGHNDARNMLR
jgi:hypothetical protein